MKALVWKDKDLIALEDVPDPEPEAGKAIIRVGAASFCGSDVTIVSGKHPRAKAPLVLGHEFMGTIESFTGALPPGIAVGQRVAVEPLLACGSCRECSRGDEHVCENLKLLGVEANGAFAEYVNVPLQRIYPLPETISDQEGALIEPLAVAVHAVEEAAPGPEDRVAIFGGGPIGLLVAQVARSAGAADIFIIEPNDFRRQLAAHLGLKTIDPAEQDPVAAVLELTQGKGADVTFDAAGVPAIGSQMIPISAIKAKIVMVAIHKKPCVVFFQQLAYREQTIVGVRIYARGNFEKAIRMCAEGEVRLRPLIYRIFPFEEAIAAFNTAKSGAASCKVVVHQRE